MINISDLYKLFIDSVNYNIQILYKTIKELKLKDQHSDSLNSYIKKYESYIKLRRLSCSEFYEVLEHINRFYESELLNGRKVNLGSGNGTLKIVNKRPNKSITRINWGESNKLKQELIEQGYKPYKKKDGGIKWLIYNEEDVVPYIVWHRSPKSSPLVSMIFNSANNTGFTPSQLLTKLNKDEIISNNKLGITRKIRLLINNDINYKSIFNDL